MKLDATLFKGDLVPVLLLGAVGLLVLGVQPLLYAAYVHQGMIGAERLGTLAAVEISAIACGSLIGVRLLERNTTRVTGLIGLILFCAGNLLPQAVPLLMSRPLAGIGGGMVVALAATRIAQQENVNAASGLFLFLQAISQYAIMQSFVLLAPHAAAKDVQWVLAVLAILVAPVLLMIPPKLAGFEEAKTATPPPLVGWIVLTVCGLFVGAAVGVWAYLGVWIEAAGLPAEKTSGLLTAALAGQVAGTLIAILLGTHSRSGAQVMLSGFGMFAAVIALLTFGPHGLQGWILLISFGFTWMIGTPALSGLLLACDPERRSLPYAASAQLLGAATVPTLVGEIFAEKGIDIALSTFAGICAIAIALVPISFLIKLQRR